MIQILGLRHKGLTNSRPPASRKDYDPREVFFEKRLRLSDVRDVFTEALDDVLSKVPEDQRYNLYFTVANSYEEKGRKMREQWAIPFDIDKIHVPDTKEELVESILRITDIVAEALDIPSDALAVLFSGHGVQLFVLMDKPFTDVKVFSQYKQQYHAIARKIAKGLESAGIQGTIDSSVWSKGRLMRLPNTMNIKPEQTDRMAFVVQSGRQVTYQMQEPSAEQAQPRAMVLRAFPKPDTQAVCKECKFLEHCRTKQNEVSEPAWYAALSVLAHLDDGEKLVHEYSKDHEGYNEYETTLKYEQAVEFGGVRTCADIDTRWDGCKDCVHYGMITSPIMIKGEGYIASKDFGFRERKQKIDASGNAILVAGKPEYEDLIKQFNLETRYKAIEESQQIVIYKDNHWQYISKPRINEWLSNKVRPEPSVQEMTEFHGRLMSRNVVSLNDMYQSTEGLMNFSNVVVNMMTGEEMQHSPEFGFFDIRPFAYDPRATSPIWDKFLSDICEGDESKQRILTEFAGYAISGDSYWLQKALVLYGDGANGKSVFMETLGELVGAKAHSTVAIQDLDKPTVRKSLENKLFNYSGETSPYALVRSETFKEIVAGGMMSVKQLYVQEYTIANRAKIIMSCNHLPVASDNSHGFYRRLIIVHLNRRFSYGTEGYDPFIKQKLITELSGICNSLIAGYKRLRQQGTLTDHEQAGLTVAAFKDTNDPLNLFIDERVVFEAGERVKCNELYADYVAYCELNNYKPKASNAFGRELLREFPHILRVRRTLSDGSKPYYYEGLRIEKGY